MAGLLAAGLAPAPVLAVTPVTPDPLKPRIAKSGIRVALRDFCRPPATLAKAPRANLNFLHHAGDGSGEIYCCDSRGKLWRIDPASGAVALFLDLVQARGSALLASDSQMGLRSFAFHPDFARPGTAGYGRLYTAHTETAASWQPGIPLFAMAPGVPVDHHNVVCEWRVFSRNRAEVKLASRRELLRTAQFGISHNLDQLRFDPSLAPGAPGYGLLFIGCGDGGNTPDFPDRYGHAQDPGRALGKILRIDPLPGAAPGRYAVPADNPFVGRAGVLPEIWALGLRHPQSITIDRVTGTMLIADIGQAQIEEVNLGVAGANYGWSLREGTFASKAGDETVLYPLPTPDGWRLPGEAALRPFAYPVAQYDRSEGFAASGAPLAGSYLAITGGFVYRGSAVPALAGHYLCGDLVNGRIFHVPLSELRPGRQAPLRELTLTRGGGEVTLLGLMGARNRVDLRLGEGEDGAIYVLSKQDGMIRKLLAA
ncbi:MAG: PQQ-dependent sugar dehydrogenase [Geminicoccaceae bacterium]